MPTYERSVEYTVELILTDRGEGGDPTEAEIENALLALCPQWADQGIEVVDVLVARD